MDLFGASNCLLTATEVWGAVTVLNVAMEERDEPLDRVGHRNANESFPSVIEY